VSVSLSQLPNDVKLQHQFQFDLDSNTSDIKLSYAFLHSQQHCAVIFRYENSGFRTETEKYTVTLCYTAYVLTLHNKFVVLDLSVTAVN